MPCSGLPLRILAIDPGREKCGLAVVDARQGVLARGVVPARLVGEVARAWTTAHRPNLVVVGSGTALKEVRAALAEMGVPLEVIPEGHTTLRARTRTSRRTPRAGGGAWSPRPPDPPVPVDDYAAVIIAEMVPPGRRLGYRVWEESGSERRPGGLPGGCPRTLSGAPAGLFSSWSFSVLALGSMDPSTGPWPLIPHKGLPGTTEGEN